MAIRISAHTMGLPHLTIDQAVELCSRQGFDAIELIYQTNYRCAVSEQTPDSEIARVARLLRDAGLGLSCLVPYVKAYNSLNRDTRTQALLVAKRSVEVAAALETKAIRILTGREVEEGQEQSAWAAMVEALGQLAAFADSHGIDLYLENHMDTQLTTGAQMAALVAALNHPRVGITYDPANLKIMGNDHRAGYESQRQYIRHVHLNDLRNEPGAGYVAAQMGQGEMPLQPWVQWLIDDGYDRFLTIEYVYRWEPERLPRPEIGLPGELAAVRAAVQAAGGKLAR